VRALAAHPAAAHPDADALAATLLLHGARLTGQLDEAGDIVLLPGQPRDRWDAGMVRMGLAHLQAAQRAQRLSRWHLQAGIAAEHATAADYAHTNWAAIVRYYEMLLALDGSAAPRLGHAIALAEAGEPALALQRLQVLQAGLPAALAAHGLAAQARAHERLGDVDLALQRLQQAVAAAPHAAEARALARRAQSLRPVS
jgi:RNA polymerase sigma-70 factor (ECF subfamily)